MHKKQLRDLVNKILTEYNLFTKEASDLIYYTIGMESLFGKYIRQIPKGTFDINKHALGICQIEKNTFMWLKGKYKHKYNLHKVRFEELEYNLKYSILFCRLRYLAVKKNIPKYGNGNEYLKKIGKYWKVYYNTSYGSGSVKEFMRRFSVKRTVKK